jgi:hypothetical protein
MDEPKTVQNSFTEQEWKELQETEKRENRIMVYIISITLGMCVLGLLGIWLVVHFAPR